MLVRVTLNIPNGASRGGEQIWKSTCCGTMCPDMRPRCVSDTTARPGVPTGQRWGGLENLNLRGAWVELPERVMARSTLEIALDTPAGDVPLVAHVAWTCPAEHPTPFLHGLRFTGITAAGRDRDRHAPRRQDIGAPGAPLLRAGRDLPHQRHRVPGGAQRDPGPVRPGGGTPHCGPRAHGDGNGSAHRHAVRPDRRRRAGRLGRGAGPAVARGVVPSRTAVSPGSTRGASRRCRHSCAACGECRHAGPNPVRPPCGTAAPSGGRPTWQSRSVRSAGISLRNARVATGARRGHGVGQSRSG